jgi:nucleoside-diphosphate-sugar epimerase
MFNTNRILVTGATGKVGQAFIRRLLADPNFDSFVIRALCHNRVPKPIQGSKSFAVPSNSAKQLKKRWMA